MTSFVRLTLHSKLAGKMGGYSFPVDDPAPKTTMKISIKLFSKKEPVVLEVANDATLGDLKGVLQEREGIPLRHQQVIFKRRPVRDNSQMLTDYNIADGSVVVVAVTDVNESDEAALTVPLDRCFDVQWNPPGVPELSCSSLRRPYGDRGESNEHAFYTFKGSEEKISLVRVTPCGENKNGPVEETVVFESCEWVSFNGQVLHFDGNGSFGTLVKGIGIPAGSEDGFWSGCYKPDHSEVMQWLRLNFSETERVEVTGSPKPEANGIYTVERGVNPDRRYVRDGNPFGRCYRKEGTDRTLWPDREGNWCLAKDYEYNDTGSGSSGNKYNNCPVFPWDATLSAYCREEGKRKEISVKLLQ